jgi:hypothetical protein
LGFYLTVNAFLANKKQLVFTPKYLVQSLLLMILCDVQLLIGLVQYYNNGWLNNILNGGMAATMKNPITRFFTVEHILGMLIAWALVHFGYVKIKRGSTDAQKYRAIYIFFGIALFIIFLSIPWPMRQSIARPLFRGL